MFFKKREKAQAKTSKVWAVQNGPVIPVTKVNDEAFSSKALGDGVAVIPEGGTILSPVDGTIINIASTHHAYGIQAEDGTEILVHIGIDTVSLKGKGFENLVEVDQKVKVGTPLCNVDLAYIKENGCQTDVIILLTDPDACGNPIYHTGITAAAAKTCVIEYSK
jgi:sugar PTS system EIIA component